jgi:hypothetical protein
MGLTYLPYYPKWKIWGGRKSMKKKIVSILVCMLLIGTTIVLVPEDFNVKASGNGGEDGLGLDYDYIYNITQMLSKIIDTAYEEGEIAKGRAFGTEGEHLAANKIRDNMSDLDLYNITPNYLEQIENRPSGFDKYLPSINLTDNLEILSLGVTVNDEVNGTNTTVVDRHIRPLWNWRVLLTPFEYLWPNIDEILEEIESIFGFNTSDNYVYSMIVNESWLTKNVSYENLSLKHVPINTSWFNVVLFNKTEDICDNDSIVDYPSFMHYFLPAFQEYHNFTFGELNSSNAGEKLDWFDEQWDSLPLGGGGDFLYFYEDPEFNPNASDIYPRTKELLDWLEDHPCLDKLFREFILKSREQIEMLLWNLTMPHCKGLVLYDFNDNTYDMNYRPFCALPTLYINGTTGKPINARIDYYNISFWVNQSWSEGVESYNVIGQINGTNSNETVIVGCLYDSWWCQGTADSAIGTGMVLAIAKYFKDHNITPKCNVKFILFSGEEYGARGAYYYEAKHHDENITTMIDLNQLGFSQSNPRLMLNVVINNESINSTVTEITKLTNYINRTGNTSDFRTVNTTEMSYLSDLTPFNENRSISIVGFVKDFSWKLHHRDGRDQNNSVHEEGDVLKYYN